MVSLFQRLGPDLAGGTAESLRRAQLALIEQDATAHPFFWAAFTVIGDGARRSEAGTSAEVPPSQRSL
jgi:CHAT domain-containing protein